VVNLALKYRPQSFDDIIGQRLAAVVLSRMVEKSKVPEGILIAGPSGTGKTTAARVLASKLDADSIEVDGASKGGVAEVRALVESLRYGHAGEHRVVIIDEAQSITRDGFNTFLKTLEEPPSGTIFVFCTTEPEKIPETVKGRLIEFEFRRVTPQDIYDRLIWIAEQEDIALPTDILSDIAQRADGSVRAAIMLMDQVARAEVVDRAEYEDLLGIHDSGPRLLAAIVLGNRSRAFEILDAELQVVGSPAVVVSQLIRVIRDITVLHGGGVLELTGRALEIRQSLAARTDPERVYRSARTLWELKTRMRFNDDPRGNLELALMLMLDTYTAGQDRAKVVPKPVEEPQPPKRKLTIDELRQRSAS
jgi:DNA polymerase-3 subunit gamma/tau